MKNTIKKIAIVAISLMSLGNLSAQKIAHVNLDSLINIMPETKNAKEAAQNYLKDLEKSVAAMSSEYENKLQAYQTEADKMSDLVRKTKEEELMSIQRRIEDFRMQAQQDYQRKSAELSAPIYEKAKKAIESVAKEGGFKYVLDTTPGASAVLFSEPSDDIFAQVKKKLEGMPPANVPTGVNNSNTGGVKPPKSNSTSPTKKAN